MDTQNTQNKAKILFVLFMEKAWPIIVKILRALWKVTLALLGVLSWLVLTILMTLATGNSRRGRRRY